MNITQEIKIVDGKAYMVTTQPLTSKDLEAIKARRELQLTSITTYIAEIDDKLPAVKAAEEAAEAEADK